MKIKNIAVIALVFVVVLIFCFILIDFFSKDIDKFRNDRSYTIYDSQAFYEPIKNIHLSDIDKISGLGPGNFSYLAYPAYLLVYKEILYFFGVENISYRVALLSNLIILLFIAVLFYKALLPDKSVHLLLYALAFFDFSLIAFSLTLEREVFASLFLALLGILFYKGINQKKWSWFWISIVFVISLNIRILLPIIFIVSIIIYYILNWFNKIKGFAKYPILIVLFIIISYVLTIFFPAIDKNLLEGQSGSGLGATIASLPLYLRVSGYSILYFVSPIPIVSVLHQNFLFPYEYFLAFSGITYLFFWIFLLKNYKYIDSKQSFLIVVLIVSHIFFGGLLYNIRHRTDIIVLLIIVFLYLMRIKLNKGFTVKYLLNESLLLFLTSISIIVVLHTVYYGIKFI